MKPGSSLVAGLKRALKAKGLTYKDVAQRLGLSEAGIKRALAKESSLTLGRLEELCRLLGVTLADLIKESDPAASAGPSDWTTEQELALAADEPLYAYFCLLLAGLAPATIIERYQFSAAESRQYLSQLDRLRLIDLGPGDRVRTLKGADVTWAHGGPLAVRYLSQIRHEFLDDDFRGELADLKFFYGELTPSSAEVLRKKVATLAREFRELVEMDRLDAKEPKHRVWALTAFRPWVFSTVTKYRRPPA